MILDFTESSIFSVSPRFCKWSLVSTFYLLLLVETIKKYRTILSVLVSACRFAVFFNLPITAYIRNIFSCYGIERDILRCFYQSYAILFINQNPPADSLLSLFYPLKCECISPWPYCSCALITHVCTSNPSPIQVNALQNCAVKCVHSLPV